ncbi:hypothetical protein C0995_011484, partial [Termitomyces sp. Mi166
HTIIINPGFTSATLSQVCPLNETTSLHDFSISDTDHVKKGTGKDLVRSLNSCYPRALNAHYLPATVDKFPKPPFSNAQPIWLQAERHAYCDGWNFYPTSDMRWALHLLEAHTITGMQTLMRAVDCGSGHK